LIIDPSARGVTFGEVYLSSSELQYLPNNLIAEDLSILVDKGDIECTFNISSRLSLSTKIGDINATINLLEPPSPLALADEEQSSIKVYAKTDIGDVDLRISIVAEELEMDVGAVAEPGDVHVWIEGEEMEEM
jgi:hypothetical protein